MNKVMGAGLLVLFFGAAGLLVHMQPASAAGCLPGWVCSYTGIHPPNYQDCRNPAAGDGWMWYQYSTTGNGYFTNTAGSTPCNVLGDFTSALNFVNTAGNPTDYTQDPGSLINVIGTDLYGSDYPNRVGAAFIIDYMLGQQHHNGTGNGINYAQNNFSTWANLVYNYANSTSPSYGIDWNNNTIKSCDSHGNGMTSAYSPDNGDDVIYQESCSSIATPEILFYWDDGNSWVAIGKPCGNIQDASRPYTPPPQNTDNPPTGSINIYCAPATDQLLANITYSDPDGPTTANITIGSWSSGNLPSSPVTNYPLPGPPTTDPYNSQTVTLTVNDVLPGGGPGGSPYVTTANTPIPPSCARLSCGSFTSTPATLDPFMTFSVTVTVNNDVGVTPPNAKMTLKITSPSGATVYTSGPPIATSGSGYTSSANFSPVGPLNAGSGVYHATWVLTSSSNDTISCVKPIQVVNRPYLQVFGGDVSIGSSAATGDVCTSQNSNAGIFSWNNYSIDFSGAGAQFAVQALGNIEGFASAQDASSVHPPTDLSFANQPPASVNVGGGIFGGSYSGTTGDCSGLAGRATPISNALANMDISTLPAQLPDGFNQTIYTTGNVYIGRDIAYNTVGNWSDPDQIPYFKLVVTGGNIYIGKGVKHLDGIYVAEPTVDPITHDPVAGGGGIIYTCATSSMVAADPHSLTFNSDCGQPLIINGSFIARQVQFLRTSGSVGAARANDTVTTSQAAEVFNYTPEIWLSRGGIPTDSGYKAVTSLPPVL